jgi:glutamate-1-semialdehyde 2,1-aminomutase
MTKGDGAYLWDLDGNRYLDLLCNYSSLVHGHRFEPILAAVATALETGTVWPALHEPQLELAELLCERVDSVERVRFCNSGTEAGMVAVKIARKYTRRSRVLVSATSYHGSYDGLEGGRYSAQGVAVLTATYGDAESFERVLAEHGDDIALVLCEPVQGRGVVTPPPEFLPRVLAAAHRHGALFGVDEVQTLRLAEGGAQSFTGIRPDLTMMGKIIGGGFPVGAVGGSAEVMGVSDPRTVSPLILTGTFNGNVVSCAAGVASMRALPAAEIARLNALGDRLCGLIEKAAADAGLSATVASHGSMLNLYWEDAPERLGGHEHALHALQLALLTQGVFVSPHGYLALSTPLDDRLVDWAGERFAAAYAAVASDLERS